MSDKTHVCPSQRETPGRLLTYNRDRRRDWKTRSKSETAAWQNQLNRLNSRKSPRLYFKTTRLSEKVIIQPRHLIYKTWVRIFPLTKTGEEQPWGHSSHHPSWLKAGNLRRGLSQRSAIWLCLTEHGNFTDALRHFSENYVRRSGYSTLWRSSVVPTFFKYIISLHHYHENAFPILEKITLFFLWFWWIKCRILFFRGLIGFVRWFFFIQSGKPWQFISDTACCLKNYIIMKKDNGERADYETEENIGPMNVRSTNRKLTNEVLQVREKVGN